MVFAADPLIRARKLAALRADHTQTAGLIDLVGEGRYSLWWAQEAFVAAELRPDLVTHNLEGAPL